MRLTITRAVSGFLSGHQPFGQSAPPVTRFCVRRRGWELVTGLVDHRERARRNDGAFGVWRAAMEEIGRAWLRAGFADGARGRIRLWFLLFKRLDLFDQLLMSAFVIGGHARHDVLLGQLLRERVVFKRLFDLLDVEPLARRALLRRMRQAICMYSGRRPTASSTSAFRYGASLLFGLLERPLHTFDALRLGLVRGHYVGADQRIADRSGRREDGLDAVEIFLRNGIELVVVAAGAAHGQSHERQRRRSDQIIQRVLPPALTSASAFGAEPQEAGRDHRFLRVGRVLVARELLTNELIVRLIVVERALTT